MAKVALLDHHRHSGVGRNPGASMVLLMNIAIQLASLGSGFRRNDEWDAAFVIWYTSEKVKRHYCSFPTPIDDASKGLILVADVATAELYL